MLSQARRCEGTSLVRLIAVLPLAAVLGCAAGTGASRPSPSVPGYMAPSNLTIVAETEAIGVAQEIYVTNNSSAPVVVTSVTIEDCQNVSPCGVVDLQVRVAPQERRAVASLRPIDPEQGFSYRYRYAWTAVTGR